jgi:actin-related protein 6
MRYALGLESIRGKPIKGKSKKKEEDEVVSGNWGGRRRRAQGMM